MAADVRASIRPADGPARRVQTPLAPRDTRHATRVDNFYLYSLEANMAYLAAISTPIDVYKRQRLYWSCQPSLSRS